MPRRFLLLFLPLAALLISCSDHPDLIGSHWVGLNVEYCTASETGLNYSTTDSAILADLRAAMKPDEPAFLTAIYPSYTNEVEIVLAGGQRWMLYVRERDRITFFDPDQITRSFRAGVSPDFYDKLSALLVEPIDLSREPCRMPRYL